MASTKQKKTGNRLLVPRLAAHVAHLLNEGEEGVELRPFALFSSLLQTLASDKYADGLVGAGVIALADEPELAALKYFEAVFERPLFLARANPLHKGHELFAALCRRGTAAGWELCELVRCGEPPEEEEGPEDFESVRERLARLDANIDKGNPAIRTRQKSGPLYIVAGAASAELAEQMALWGALSCSPAKLKKLRDKQAFNSFCSLMIKALEAANAPYGAFISLGLSPFDWADELSTNTARMALRFINEARGLLEEREAQGHELALWQELWPRRKVPGYKSADELWHSELGRALRHSVRPRVTPLDEFMELADDDASLMEAEDFREAMAHCEEVGVLEVFDRWFFGKLHEGWTIEQLQGEAKTIAHFGQPPDDEQMEGYVDDLHERLHAHARRGGEGAG